MYPTHILLFYLITFSLQHSIQYKHCKCCCLYCWGNDAVGGPHTFSMHTGTSLWIILIGSCLNPQIQVWDPWVLKTNCMCPRRELRGMLDLDRHAGHLTHLCGVASLSCRHCHGGQDATLALCSAWFWYPFSNPLCPVCTQPVFHLYPAKIQKSPRS